MRSASKFILVAFVVLAVLGTPLAAAEEPVSSSSTETTSTSSTSTASTTGPDPPTQGCRPTCMSF